MKNHYTPHPINTSDVTLSPELVKLANLLSANVHDVWAVGRIQEGWTYGPDVMHIGPARDDARKETPCMVPFEELSDSEKAYDLNTAFETLKVLVKLGYTITPPQEETAK